jgi:hypothetical protein
MYVYIHIHMYVFLCIFMYIYIHPHIHVCILYMFVYIYIDRYMNLLCNGQKLEYSSILGHGHQSVNRDIYIPIMCGFQGIFMACSGLP